VPTEAELLDAIDTNPDDDAPRLAHADWLEASDPQRARFIRVQLRLANAFPEEAEERDKQEEARLLEAFRERWLAGLPTPSGIQWRFRGGYPEEAVFTSRVLFEKSWSTLLVPGVRRVRFEEVAGLRRITSCPGLAHVRELVVYHRFLDDELIVDLLASPHLSGLRGLHVPAGRATAASLVAMARLPALERLTFNSSIPQPLAAEGTRAVAGLSGLRSLELRGWEISDEAAQALWTGHYPALTTLSLHNCGIGRRGLNNLGDGECMPALERLDLGENSLGDRGPEAIFHALRWTRLRWLSLAGNTIGAAGAAAMAYASHLASLESLRLESNAIPDDGARAFARCRLPALRRLNLANNLIGDDGMRALVAVPGLTIKCQHNPASEALIQAIESGQAPPAELVTAAPVSAPAGIVGPADEDALVRALLADPRDELARSAYADWLEEHGKPLHGEVQRLPQTDERRRRLVGELGKPAFQAFASSVASYPYLGDDGLPTVRMGMGGFVKKDFQARAASCLREHHIERIELEGNLKDWTRLGPALASSELRALDLGRSGLRDAGAKALAGCDGVGRLCALALRYSHLTSQGVAALCGSTKLERLVSIDLPVSGLSTDSMRALAHGPFAGRLRRLDFRGCRLGDTDFAVLFSSRALASALVSLDLYRCDLTDRSAAALAASANLGALRSLDLSVNRFSPAAFAILAESALLGRLRWLRVLCPGYASLDTFRPLVRAAADAPNLTLVLSPPPDGVDELREMLGPRLVLE
jgi:uncharacterized protein (TIGR02996 family)